MGRQPRQEYSGAFAWRNGFSDEAGDLMAIMLAFSWSHEEFVRALVLCARRSGGRQTNIRTVEKVIALLQAEDEEYTAARRALRDKAVAELKARIAAKEGK